MANSNSSSSNSSDRYNQSEGDLRSANRATFVAHLSRQILRQDSMLSAVEAAKRARALYDRGVRDLFGDLVGSLATQTGAPTDPIRGRHERRADFVAEKLAAKFDGASIAMWRDEVDCPDCSLPGHRVFCVDRPELCERCAEVNYHAETFGNEFDWQEEGD